MNIFLLLICDASCNGRQSRRSGVNTIKLIQVDSWQCRTTQCSGSPRYALQPRRRSVIPRRPTVELRTVAYLDHLWSRSVPLNAWTNIRHNDYTFWRLSKQHALWAVLSTWCVKTTVIIRRGMSWPLWHLMECTTYAAERLFTCKLGGRKPTHSGKSPTHSRHFAQMG